MRSVGKSLRKPIRVRDGSSALELESSMFEFKWTLPAPSGREVTLQVRSRRGWFGRKLLTCDGQTIFRRGYLEGIDTRLEDPGSHRGIELRLVPRPGTAIWRPVLLCDGVELPEVTGTSPPVLVDRPVSLGVVVGLTYLLMLICLIMLPSIVTMLDALRQPHDDGQVVLTVLDPQAPSDVLSIAEPDWPPAVEGEGFTATLRATGGTPPYSWSADRKSCPKRWKLDPQTGTLTFTPVHAGDLRGVVHVTDAAQRRIGRPVVVVVRPQTPPPQSWPAVTTLTLPVAAAGQPYRFVFQARGGRPDRGWEVAGGKLPAGLTLGSTTGEMAGVPQRAGYYPLTIRVFDKDYSPWNDVLPWAAPFLVTGGCLLGFWNMRRWGIWSYAGLIVGEVVLGVVGVLPLPPVAVALQVVVWVCGAVHVRRMV